MFTLTLMLAAMARPKPEVIVTKSRLMRLAYGAILLGLAASMLSALYSSHSSRLITINSDYFIDTAWLGWPIQYIYQTDITQPDAVSMDQSIDWILLTSNWLVWAMAVMCLSLVAVIGRHVYANRRH